jgi:hypothetical protein
MIHFKIFIKTLTIFNQFILQGSEFKKMIILLLKLKIEINYFVHQNIYFFVRSSDRTFLYTVYSYFFLFKFKIMEKNSSEKLNQIF